MRSFSLTRREVKDANFGTVAFVFPQFAYSETTANSPQFAYSETTANEFNVHSLALDRLKCVEGSLAP